MKLRAGFVSNSSTSSYCIVGKDFDNFEDLRNFFRSNDIPCDDDDDDFYDKADTLRSVLRTKFDDDDIHVLCNCYYGDGDNGSGIIGLDIDNRDLFYVEKCVYIMVRLLKCNTEDVKIMSYYTN